MERVAELIAELKEKSAERDNLIRTLEMWNKVEAQGIQANDVLSFTFKEDWITAQQKRQRLQANRRMQSDPFVDGTRPKVYNAVKMKDETWRKLDPAIEAP